jgi:EAL domain-containing protein (putative c-di-GMP-specific phosphodiesterase class I)
MMPHCDEVTITPAADDCMGTLLLVDDEELTLRAFKRTLTGAGYSVVTADGVAEALARMSERSFDCAFVDISMRDGNGLDVLRAIHAHDARTAVVLMTGSPTLETAIDAVSVGARRYLVKPVGAAALTDVAHEMVQGRKQERERESSRASDDARLDRALDAMFMVYQPIVSWRCKEAFAYEALLRTREPSVPNPGVLLDLAQRCGRLPDLGRRVRAAAAQMVPRAPRLFVNLHPADLLDDELYEASSPLSTVASRVVLEVTERDGLNEVADLTARLARLHALGYRVAIDDLGEGYAGLTSLARVQPEFVKLDMSLVRGVDRSPTAQHIVRSTLRLCRELSCLVIAEGVETPAERDALLSMGYDLLQGYLLGRPQPELVSPAFE